MVNIMSVKVGKFSVGIGAIIEHTGSGKILLLHRASTVDFESNKWDDVGGRMHQFENPEETLRREIEEETGIGQIRVVKPIDVSHYFRGSKKATNEMIVITYWCMTASNDIRLSDEHDEYRWVLPEEALQLTEDLQLKRNIKRFIEERSIKISQKSS